MEQILDPFLIGFFWMCVLIPFGIFLRNRFNLFQKYLVPSSLIAGFIGMILMHFELVGMWSPEGWTPLPFETFALLTTLLFTLNFTFIGINAGKSGGSGSKGKDMTRGVVWLTVTFVGGYGVLIIVGLAVITAYNALTAAGLETATAVNLVQGFTGGPAQAMVMSQIWVENAANTDIIKLITITPDVLVMAVSYGAVGFLVASFVGVPLANYGLKKGLAEHTTDTKLDDTFIKGIMPKDSTDPIARHTLHPANLDTLTFHFALLGIALFFTWWLSYSLKQILPADLASLGFGLMFMWGMSTAILIRKAINAMGLEHLVDDQLVNRINGLLVDFLMITALMSVQWNVLAKYIVPFTITVVLASIALFFWFWIPSRWLGKSGLERFLVKYAACTPTLASSLLLMRIVDPTGKSLVPAEAGFSQFAMILPLAPLVFFVTPALGVRTTVGTVLIAGIAMLAAATVILLLLKKIGYWNAETKSIH
jgi:ESS family glutamate:Na+ symporter